MPLTWMISVCSFIFVGINFHGLIDWDVDFLYDGVGTY